MEELMDIRWLVCLNNGNGIWIDIHTNTMSCLDLKLVSDNIATSAEWCIESSSSIGSDHFPIGCAFDVEVDIQRRPSHKKWWFEKADWEIFKETCKAAESVSMEGNRGKHICNHKLNNKCSIK